MKHLINSVLAALLILITVNAQTQTFSFVNKNGISQATFESDAPLESVTGVSTEVSGTATLDINDLENTLKGSVSIPTASLKTGIEMRDGHLQSSKWLDAEKYPDIVFDVKKVSDVQKIADNKFKAKVTGDFSVHGVTKEEAADVTLTYMKESEATKSRIPGDLLGVQAEFMIKLSDYKVKNTVLGQRVANDIKIKVNLVGTNKF